MTEGIDQEMHRGIGKSRAQLAVVLIAALACIAVQDASAQNAERSGKEVVDSVCIACHGTGAHGAPKIGNKKAWGKLASRGLTGLSRNALKGIRDMPPHGGNPNLTDTEIERAITYMVNQSGGTGPSPSAGRPRPRSVAANRSSRCSARSVTRMALAARPR